MIIKTKGVVIKQRAIGERDAIITILTDEHGVIEASVRGIKSTKSKLQSGSQMLNYSLFTLFKGKSGYIVNETDSIESFYNIRLDIKKLSLSSYFCDIISFTQTIEETSNEILRLLLNTLYVLSEDLRSNSFVKAVFEFKFMCISGFMPQMDCCAECYGDNIYDGYFLLTEGIFICKNCFKQSTISKAELNESVVKTLRYIAQNGSNKIFALHIGEHTLDYISKLTEYYLIYHCGHNFQTLDFYKNL